MILSYEEEQFIAAVRCELKRYEMTSSQVEAVVEQIQEHLEASREHGENGLEDLGSPNMYVRDYAEVQGLVRVQDARDLESVPEEPEPRSGRLSVWGFMKYPLVFAAVYILCQLLFSFSLTTANSIRLFAPDIAYMTLGIVASLAWMGLVLMYGMLVNRRKHLESVTRRA